MTTVLTQARLKEILSYDRLTGAFTWKIVDPRAPVCAGDKAGHVNKRGYVEIRIDGKKYLAHRLAWFYVHGEWPVFLDHKRGLSNRIANLRPATKEQNAFNIGRRRDNASGVIGVYWSTSHCKWRAQIKYSGKLRHLGFFEDIEDAAEFRDLAARMVQGDFHHGRAA